QYGLACVLGPPRAARPSGRYTEARRDGGVYLGRGACHAVYVTSNGVRRDRLTRLRLRPARCRFDMHDLLPIGLQSTERSWTMRRVIGAVASLSLAVGVVQPAGAQASVAHPVALASQT